MHPLQRRHWWLASRKRVGLFADGTFAIIQISRSCCSLLLDRHSQSLFLVSFAQFYDASQFSGSNLGWWDVSSAKNLKAMFYGATSFNADLSEWQVGQATDMSMMFYRCASFEQNLWRWSDLLENDSVLTDDMFEKSGCPIWRTPDPSALSSGPWCLLSRNDVAPLPEV